MNDFLIKRIRSINTLTYKINSVNVNIKTIMHSD